MNKFEIVCSTTKHVRRFRLTGRNIVFKIKKTPQDEEPVNWVRSAVEQIVLHICKDVDPQDQVGFTFCSGDFNKDGWLNFTEAANVTVEDVWSILEKIFQSNSTGMNTDTFRIAVTIIKLPRGSGRSSRRRKYNSFVEECAKRKGIISIANKDHICLARAIVVAVARAEKNEAYNNIRLNAGKIQTTLANELMEKTQIFIPETGAGIPEIHKFQNYFNNKFKITVYNYTDRSVIFEGPDAPLKIYLLFHKKHFNVITSLTAVFACSYFCEVCHVPYDHKNIHRCGGSCPACQQSPSCERGLRIVCDECNRHFRGKNCFDFHKKNSVCENIKKCNDCLKTIRTNREHTCDEIFCKTCQKHVPSTHLCYMKPLGERRESSTLYMFYDLESTQEKIVNEISVQHIPNLCVFKQYCDNCLESAKEICEKCGVRLQKLQGRKIIEGFVYHLLTIRKKFKNVIVIAHNGQAYDHQFILNHILIETDLTPELIMRGSKIISLVLTNVKFIDSLNYFPMALSKFPKTFGLGDDFKKGYFPHLFNTGANQNYVGPLPPVSYYTPDSMKPEDRASFLLWHKSQQDTIFDFQKELIEYCVSDVEILAQACLKFRRQMLDTCDVCPFSEAVTIASACNKIFRRNFLKPDTIGLIPRGGYRFRDKQSKIALKWLIREEIRRGVNILHAGKQSEPLLNGYKVDGFCPETNQVYEFHGCYFHRHDKCFKYNRDQPLHDDPHETFNIRFESTVSKTERLKALGYEVVEMWECDFRKELKRDEETAKFLENHTMLCKNPLNPRDAFYGGRTGNTKLFYKIEPGEKIKYFDVCSLYPFICKTGKFPVGHPKILVGGDCPTNIDNTEGLIKCKVLPPRNLYHPVLPLKANNKLLFALCRTCALESCTDCNHSIEQRALTGTWIIDEVKKAIEKGYELLETYEIWQYDVEQYDTADRTGGLFTDMMNTFLKIKQQASGWPENCVDDEQKHKYIDEFFNSEGIQLNFCEIGKNSGLRALAKLILNSFWGKFGQRENQAKTKIVRNPEQFFNMLYDSSIEINTVLPINEDVLVVNYEYKEETFDILPTVNVCLAAYTTAQARLKLYSYLELLDCKTLYYDTDSVIFISRENEPEPQLGMCVGQLTDELDCFGVDSYITEFACAGPKSYAYKIYSPSTDKFATVCKVKGVTLNYETSDLINFEKLKKMILNDEPPVYITNTTFQRTQLHEVLTTKHEKVFQITSRKRKFNDVDSVPYGYQDL